MSGPKCAFNTAAALRRVFIPSNLGTSEYHHVTRIFVPALLASASIYEQARAQARAASSWATPPPTRPSPYGSGGSVGGSSYLAGGRAGLSPRDMPPRRGPIRPLQEPHRVKVKLARLPRDDEIRPPFVHLLTGATDEYGVPIVSNAQSTKETLAKLDLKTFSLQVIEPNLPAEHLETLKWPVCKIVNKREELEKAKKEKEKKKASTIKEKTLELNWALAPHDQDTKMRQMQKFLTKGYRVMVLLMKKQNGKARASKEDMQALVDKIVESMKEVPGATEWKGREGALGNTLKIFLQGKVQQKTEREDRKKGKKVEERIQGGDAE